ncbi:MAG: hypothetical protein Q9218_005113 [Villophora microphyllina]
MEGESRVDLILGGHDHLVLCRLAGDINADPEVIFPDKVYGGIVIESKILEQWTDITQDPAYNSLPKSLAMTTTLSSVYARITEKVQHPHFHSKVPLDGRLSVVRSQETNLGNLLADAVRAFYGTDFAFVNSGGIRCDRLIQPTAYGGDSSGLTVKDMIGPLKHHSPLQTSSPSTTPSPSSASPELTSSAPSPTPSPTPKQTAASSNSPASASPPPGIFPNPAAYSPRTIALAAAAARQCPSHRSTHIL